jgi:hypothetical protein
MSYNGENDLDIEDVIIESKSLEVEDVDDIIKSLCLNVDEDVYQRTKASHKDQRLLQYQKYV